MEELEFKSMREQNEELLKLLKHNKSNKYNFQLQNVTMLVIKNEKIDNHLFIKNVQLESKDLTVLMDPINLDKENLDYVVDVLFSYFSRINYRSFIIKPINLKFGINNDNIQSDNSFINYPLIENKNLDVLIYSYYKK